MAKRIAITNLNANTVDILNVIRSNASPAYREQVPEITDIKQINQVGDVLFGYPALANEFVQALVNRIALVRVKSTTFNNMFADLKKGYLDFGEVVEEVFVNLAKAREFSVAKAEKREFQRVLPDVRSAFHAVNYKVQYPMTIQNVDLRMAFTREDGVLDLIAKIVDSMYKANEYDEFLLFKYLLIKAIAKGKMYPVGFDGSDTKNAGIAFRAISNDITFVKTKYNASNVHTNTPKEDQQIFMDSTFNAKYDVNVLASAFNMDKAEYQGRLRLLDDFTTFDNERFSEIIENSDMLEPITDEELALMADVKACLLDKEWFQVYDELTQFTEVYVSSGLYWNYNLNIWKIISSSPFSNAVVFVDTQNSTKALPNNYTAKITGKDVSDIATILTVELNEVEGFAGGNQNFVQTDDATQKGIAVHKYGAIMIPPSSYDEEIDIAISVDGDYYIGGTKVSNNTAIGTTITLSPVDDITEIGVESATGSLFEVPVTDMQTGVTVSGDSIKGTLKWLDGDNAITQVWGEGNFLCLKFNADDWSDYTSVKVGLEPSAGSGLVEIKDDDTHDGVFKISNKKQKFVVVATNGIRTITKKYRLSGLTLQTASN